MNLKSSYNQARFLRAPIWKNLSLFNLQCPWPISEKIAKETQMGVLSDTKSGAHRIYDLPSLVAEGGHSNSLYAFCFLPAFHKNGDNYYRKLSRVTISSWMDIHSKRQIGVVDWSIQNLCNRLKNWLYSYDFYGVSANNEFKKHIEKSFNYQIKVLRKLYVKEKDSYLRCLALQTLCLIFIFNERANHALFYLAKLIKLSNSQFLEDGGHISKKLSEQIEYVSLLTELSIHLKNIDIPEVSKLKELTEKTSSILRFFGASNACIVDFEKNKIFDKQLYQRLLNYSHSSDATILPNMGYIKGIIGDNFPVVLKTKPTLPSTARSLSSQLLLWQISTKDIWLKQSLFLETTGAVALKESVNHAFVSDLKIHQENGHTLINVVNEFFVIPEVEKFSKRPVFIKIEREVHIDKNSGIIRGHDTLRAAKGVVFGYKMYLPKNSSKLHSRKQNTYLIDLTQHEENLMLKVIFDGHDITQRRRSKDSDILILSKELSAETPYTFKWAMQMCDL